MSFRNLLIASSLLAAPAMLQAQTAPATPAATATPEVGATVNGSDNAVIGTVKAVTPQAIVIDTGANQVPVPPTAVGKDAKGAWHMEMTKTQLDAAAQQAAAQAQAATKAALVPGAAVTSSDGQNVGTIKEADAQFVTITTAKGDVKVPVQGFSAGPNGVVVGATAAQLTGSAAAAATTAPAAPATPGAATTPQ